MQYDTPSQLYHLFHPFKLLPNQVFAHLMVNVLGSTRPFFDIDLTFRRNCVGLLSCPVKLSDIVVSSAYFLSSLKITVEANLNISSPTCAFMDKVDEFIACLVLAVAFNGESICLKQVCKMQLRVACEAEEALTCLQVCFDVFSIHSFQHVSEHIFCPRLIKTLTFSPLAASFIS